MWFLMSFIPDAFLAWVVNTILIAGAVGFVASFFFGFVLRYLPSLAPYRMIIQIVSIVLLVAGVYFKGGYGVEMSWRERVRELEEKIKIAEAKSVQANEDLEKVRKEKVKVIRDTKVVVQEKIVKVAEKLDSECKVDPQAVKILNEAAGKK
jgi:uncharacterized protein YacL